MVLMVFSDWLAEVEVMSGAVTPAHPVKRAIMAVVAMILEILEVSMLEELLN